MVKMKNTKREDLKKKLEKKKRVDNLQHNTIILSTDMAPPAEAKDWNIIFTRLK